MLQRRGVEVAQEAGLQRREVDAHDARQHQGFVVGEHLAPGAGGVVLQVKEGELRGQPGAHGHAVFQAQLVHAEPALLQGGGGALVLLGAVRHGGLGRDGISPARSP